MNTIKQKWNDLMHQGKQTLGVNPMVVAIPPLSALIALKITTFLRNVQRAKVPIIMATTIGGTLSLGIMAYSYGHRYFEENHIGQKIEQKRNIVNQKIDQVQAKKNEVYDSVLDRFGKK